MTLKQLAKHIQLINQHPRLKDLVAHRNTVMLPEINHELYTRLFVIFVGCNELLLNQYNTANYNAIQTLKDKYGIDVQVVGKHCVRASLMLSKGRFTFT